MKVIIIAVAAVFLAGPFATAQRILVNHTSVALFEHIPSAYAEAASQLRLLFMDRSVGGNINDALSCLSRPHAEAPNSCKRFAHRDERYAVDPSEVHWKGSWDRGSWQYAFWPAGCAEDPRCFIDYAEARVDSFDVLGFQFSYLAVMPGSRLADPATGFFGTGATGGSAADYAAFEARHPSKKVIWWTTSLARSIGTVEARDFNDAMRAYARTHDLVLFDVADILSHDPSGQPCFDNRDGVPYLEENHPDDGMDLPAICPQYTTETEGGHLGSISAGGIRVAKAFWVLMARIAGWDGRVTAVQNPVSGRAPTAVRLDVRPNPSHGDLQLQLATRGNADVVVRLVDMFGREVLPRRNAVTDERGRLTLSVQAGRQPAGMYVLLLQLPGEIISRRIILL
ncbi:MAG: T9SS type A sorting domain-containing protein [Bacteroidota bacterium]|nr:T9SS type A sorting domain-containing protein [Bacteroidota bacterium]